jgi:hypothetical protein
MAPRNDKGRHLCRPRFTYGAGEKSRTPDLRITNALLYQLSYTGVALTIEDGRGEPRILAERHGPHFIAKSASFLATGVFFSVA